jgi:hypothetical protein
MQHEVLADLPSFSVGANFLDANSQAHHKPITAFGDLTDNAENAGATALHIDVEQAEGSDVLTITMTDNGCGMSEHTLRTGYGGVAFSDKAHRAEVHYGMGAKSSLPRLSPSTLVFSKDGRMRTVALISSTLSRDLGTSDLRVPVTTWDVASGHLLCETTADADLTHGQRCSSLKVLLKHTRFHTEAELLAQFDAISGRTGTRLVMYECHSSQFDIGASSDDIKISRDGASDEVVLPHDVSLRSYLEVLYYADTQTTPTMLVWLRGKPVPPRDWTDFLHHWPSMREPYTYNPACLRDESSDKASGAEVRFGTALDMGDLIALFSAKRHDHRRLGLDSDEALAQRKAEVRGYTGVFYYNHGRLIMPCERLPKQAEVERGNKMMTTEKRLSLYGTGVIGVCREGFLTPEHNKAGYEAKSYEPSVYARPGRPSFQDLHKKQVNDFLKDFLREALGPAYHAAKAQRQAQQAQLQTQTPAVGSLPALMPPNAAAAGARSSVPVDRYEPPELATSSKLVKKRKRQNDAQGAAQDSFNEGARYRLREDPSNSGEGLEIAKGWYCVRKPDGSLSRNVRLVDLELVGFEQKQLPPGFVLADVVLDGTLAAVVWGTGRKDDPLMPQMCTMRTAGTSPGPEGSVLCYYFDGEVEPLFVAIRPIDGACIIFDKDGVSMLHNPSGPCTANSVYIDGASIERAAGKLLQAQSGGVSAGGSSTGGRHAGSNGVRSTSAGHVGGSNGVGAGASGGGGGGNAAPQRPAADDHPASVHSLLTQARLAQYTDVFIDNGWDDVQWLLTVSEAMLDSLAADVGMKRGHFERFKAVLRPDLGVGGRRGDN